MNKPDRNLQAFIGHFLDLYKIASFNFINPHSYTKFRQIKSIQEKTRSTVFIETGTYRGVTTKRCSSLFEKIYTVELDEKLAVEAAAYLADEKHVEVIQGDALEALPKILEDDSVNNVLIFLDGHFSGGETACSNLPEPAIEELKIISKYSKKVKGIVIDDFRLFGTEHGFPTKSELIKAAESYFDGYEIIVHLDQLIIAKSK
jgi:hypothetical protein